MATSEVEWGGHHGSYTSGTSPKSVVDAVVSFFTYSSEPRNTSLTLIYSQNIW